MKEKLRKFIQEHVKNPKEEEIQEILSLFHEKKFLKGEYFKEPFTSSNDFAFLPKGSVRVLVYKDNGDEITVNVREDNSFIVDPFRLEGKESSPLGIECLENLTLLVASVDALEAP